MTPAESAEILADLVTTISDLLRIQLLVSDESDATARQVVDALGLSVQSQTMPRRLYAREGKPGWYWSDSERVECVRLVTPWRELADFEVGAHLNNETP